MSIIAPTATNVQTAFPDGPPARQTIPLNRFAAAELHPRVEYSPITDGDGGPEPAFVLRSEIKGGGVHFIDLVDNRAWQILPAAVADHIDVGDLRKYVTELKIAITTADVLNKRTPRIQSPADTAITGEVSALVADRGWSLSEAAHRLGWTRAKLSHRMGGFSAWTIDDLNDVAIAVTDDADDEEETFLRLITLASRARRTQPVAA